MRKHGAAARPEMTFVYFALVLSAASILHIVVGYPLLLARRMSRCRPPVAKDRSFTTSVSVIVAVHNGESMIRRKLETLPGLDYPRALMSIIVVSDGSTDTTEEIVREFEDRGVTLLVAPRGGKAQALNRGLAAADGEIVFFTDVRQPLDPPCLQHLVANFADPSVGAVTGELRLLRGDSGEQADMDLYWIWARTRQSEIDSLFNTPDASTRCEEFWLSHCPPIPLPTMPFCPFGPSSAVTASCSIPPPLHSIIRRWPVRNFDADSAHWPDYGRCMPESPNDSPAAIA